MTTRRGSLAHVALGQTMNAGLWLDRFLDTGTEEVAAAKFKHIARVSEIAVPTDYVDAVALRDRSLQQLHDGSAHFDVAFDGRLVAGLGFKGVLEAGLSLEHTWGTPVLEGSSLKGAARGGCVDLVGDGWAPVEDEDPEDRARGEYCRELFGSRHSVGKVYFHDAWWIPPSTPSTLPIHADIMTPHHPHYYASEPGRVPDGTDDPIPVPFPVVIGATFRIWLTGEQDWCEAAEVILRHSLYARGIGAKTDSGYGHTDTEYPSRETSAAEG